MNLKKKILAVTIIPVLVLGIVSIILTVTMVKSSVMEQVEEALKGTASSTLAAYDQNAGDYIVTTNGDIWKGSYNVSKSENLVDRIKENTGMDVTFFYGTKRVMTSALDANGERILGSPAGDVITQKVLNDGEEYFTSRVSLDGVMNYGYYMPVYQNGSNDKIIGMVFVGTNKADKDTVLNRIIVMICTAVVIVMAICIGISMKIAYSISSDIKRSVGIVEQVAGGSLNIDVDKKLLNRKDEIGDLARGTVSLSNAMNSVINEISSNSKLLLETSGVLGEAADNTDKTMNEVSATVNQMVENSSIQSANSKAAFDHMKIMENNISETTSEAALLNESAVSMQKSGTKVSETLFKLCNINDNVKDIIEEVKEQTNRTNESVNKINSAISFISAVAEETNLLSLNASIEAARAGEAGKGFSVVAEQVRILSSNTSQSAEDIVKYVAELRESIDSLASAMDETTLTLGEGNKKVEQSLAAIQQMNGQMDNISVSVDSIFNDIDTQTGVTKSLAKQIENISQSYNILSDECIQSGQRVFKLGRYLDKTRSDLVRGCSNITQQDWMRVFEVDHYVLTWRVYNNIVGFEHLKKKQVDNPLGCKLGKWLNSQTDSRLTESLEFGQLVKTHEVLHHFATLSWQAKEDGDDKKALSYFNDTYDAFLKYDKALNNLQKKMQQLGYNNATQIVSFEE